MNTNSANNLFAEALSIRPTRDFDSPPPSGSPNRPAAGPRVELPQPSAEVIICNGQTKVVHHSPFVQSASAGNEGDGHVSSDGRFLTARHQFGGTQTGAEIGPESLIYIGGRQTTVKSAVAAGFMFHDGTHYRMTGMGNGAANAAPSPLIDSHLQGAQRQLAARQEELMRRQEAEQQQREAEERAADLAPLDNTEVEGAIARVANSVPADIQLRAIANIAEAVTTKGEEGLAEVLNYEQCARIADYLGVEPNAAEETVGRIVSGFAEQAHGVFANLGLDSDEVLEHYRSNAPHKLVEAIKTKRRTDPCAVTSNWQRTTSSRWGGRIRRQSLTPTLAMAPPRLSSPTTARSSSRCPAESSPPGQTSS
ncbi:MAG: hypothetical protein KIT16_11990 [Rhodospirillaceae bacterium]|nr:hypothetical protein [Rhodospirillaceae bacterium]